MTPRVWSSLTGAGLFTGAVAWAFHQQTGYIVASWACGKAPAGIWLTGAAAFLLLAAGAGVSWRGLRGVSAGHSPEAARPRRFAAIVALMASALFFYALLLQAAAALFLPGCIG